MSDESERQRRAVEQALEAENEAAKSVAAANKTPTKPPHPIPPGWYPYQPMPGTKRYWDGETWTDHYAPMEPVAPLPPQKDNTDGLIVAGFIMAILFPIGGFIAGCVLLGRKAGVAVAVMLLSVASAYVWYEMITADDDLDCAIENSERAIDGLPPLIC